MRELNLNSCYDLKDEGFYELIIRGYKFINLKKLYVGGIDQGCGLTIESIKNL